MRYEFSFMSLRVIISVLMICFSCHLSAQHKKHISTVVHLDGTKVKGEIIGQDKLSVILLVSSSDTVYVSKGNIRKIKNSKNHINLFKQHLNKGMYYNLDLFSNATNNDATVSIAFTMGQRINEKFSVGAGIAQTHNVIGNRSFTTDHGMRQVYAHSRYNISNKSNRLFVESNLGWGIASPTDEVSTHKGGIYIQPSFGIEIATKKRLSWTVKISHYVQQTSGTRMFNVGFDNNLPSFAKYDILLQRTALGIGIGF